jgi:hypothetical protein
MGTLQVCRKGTRAKLTGSNESEIWGSGEQTGTLIYIDRVSQI